MNLRQRLLHYADMLRVGSNCLQEGKWFGHWSEAMTDAVAEIDRLRSQRDYLMRQAAAVSEHAENMRLVLVMPTMVPPQKKGGAHEQASTEQN